MKVNEKNQATELYICETLHVILHVNQLYIFRVHPLCEECTRLVDVTPTVTVDVNTGEV
jgi:hypothetical protein